jgi:hypothetical protein
LVSARPRAAARKPNQDHLLPGITARQQARARYLFCQNKDGAAGHESWRTAFDAFNRPRFASGRINWARRRPEPVNYRIRPSAAQRFPLPAPAVSVTAPAGPAPGASVPGPWPGGSPAAGLAITATAPDGEHRGPAAVMPVTAQANRERCGHRNTFEDTGPEDGGPGAPGLRGHEREGTAGMRHLEPGTLRGKAKGARKVVG